jgi:hypothetical protein
MRHWIISGACLLSLAAGPAFAQSPPAEQPAPAEQTPPGQAEDPGRPVLRRGGPAKKRSDSGPEKSESDIPTSIRDLPKEPGASAPIPREERAVTAAGAQRAPGVDPLIEKARESTFDFIDTLPDFVCDQVTRRYSGHKIKPDWKYKDRFEVELFFSGSKEDYRNVRHNGKRMKKGSPEDSGQWSTGEFGSLLAALFHPESQAKFKFRTDSTAAGMPAKVYDYSVPKATSNWEVKMGFPVKPSYSGAVWIDPEHGHVLRVEMGTTSLPANYPVDKVEEVIDYDWVTIGGTKYLMPSKSSNLACQAGTFQCTKNDLEFKNYRKFNVESNILAVDSDISFPEEDVEKPKKPAGKYEPPQINAKPDEKKPEQ